MPRKGPASRREIDLAYWRRQLAGVLAGLRRPGPALPCPERGVWLEPRLYCRVRCLGWTRAGRLRDRRSPLRPLHR